jgi:hypothetical protein
MFQRFKAQVEASEYHPPLAMLQFPITATDFTPAAARLLPTKYARDIPDLTPKQREEAVAQCNEILDAFELLRRKNNLASSFAFLRSVSLGVVNRVPVWGSNTEGMLISYYNNWLANDPQFVTMAPRDKQSLYEWNIITAGRIVYYATCGTEQERRQATEAAWAILK